MGYRDLTTATRIDPASWLARATGMLQMVDSQIGNDIQLQTSNARICTPIVNRLDNGLCMDQLLQSLFWSSYQGRVSCHCVSAVIYRIVLTQMTASLAFPQLAPTRGRRGPPIVLRYFSATHYPMKYRPPAFFFMII